jgi:hypothetical protein
MVVKRYPAKTEAFYRKLILPEKERRENAPLYPNRSYRWFRSENVFCLEHYSIEVQSISPVKASAK